MVYTVTFNPSLDYIISVDGFQLGKTNRTVKEQMLPGGKGINVSTVLKNLGIPNTALGFCAGFTGEEIEKRIGEMGLNSDFIHLESGYSRINVKMKDFDGTEINGQGPDIRSEETEKLLQKLEKLEEGDTLVLAGSIPKTMSESIYRDILRRLEGQGILAVVDATGELLLNVLEYRPFLIKPNNHELGAIFNVKLENREDVVPYARKMQEKVRNSVGAGDAMVAGFLAGWLTKEDYEYAFCMGVSAGSASAFSENLATKEEVEEVYRHVKQSVIYR